MTVWRQKTYQSIWANYDALNPVQMVNGCIVQYYYWLVPLEGCRVGSSVVRAKSWNTSPWMYTSSVPCMFHTPITDIYFLLYVVDCPLEWYLSNSNHNGVILLQWSEPVFSSQTNMLGFQKTILARKSKSLLTLLECYFSKLLSGEPKAKNCPTCYGWWVYFNASSF